MTDCGIQSSYLSKLNYTYLQVNTNVNSEIITETVASSVLVETVVGQRRMSRIKALGSPHIMLVHS